MAELDDNQIRCLRYVYAYFHRESAWPIVSRLQHHLVVDLKDRIALAEVLATIPQKFTNFNGTDGEVWLTVRGVHASEGSGAQELEDFVHLVRTAVRRYEADPDARVQRGDLVAIGLTPERIRRTFLLSEHEWFLWRGGGAAADGDWYRLLSRDIWKFDGIESADEYIRRDDQLRHPQVPTETLTKTSEADVSDEIQMGEVDDETIGALADFVCGESGPLYRAGWALNSQPGMLRRVVLRLADPREYQGDLGKVREAIEGLNRILAIEGYSLGLDGTTPRIHQGVATFAEPADLSHAVPAVDFSRVVDQPLLGNLLADRWREIEICIAAGAPLAAIILMGSVLEGALLAMARSRPEEASRSRSAPKDAAGNVRPFNDWSLGQLIDVGRDCAWLHAGSSGFANVLRDYRNFIHPVAQLKAGVQIDDGTADICMRVVHKSLDDISKARVR